MCFPTELPRSLSSAAAAVTYWYLYRDLLQSSREHRTCIYYVYYVQDENCGEGRLQRQKQQHQRREVFFRDEVSVYANQAYEKCGRMMLYIVNAPCLPITTTSGAIPNEKPAIKFGDGFDVGLQSERV